MTSDVVLRPGWSVTTFRRVARVAGGLVDPTDPKYSSMRLIAPNHIESGTGRLVGKESADEQGAGSGKYVADRGDILYSKIRPQLNKVTIAPEPCLCSADMYPIRLESGDLRFAVYWMLAKPFLTFASTMADRVKMPKINRDELAGAPWVVPPESEQRAIADFLDRETAKIDALIEKQNRLVTLLRERRRVWHTSVLSHDSGWPRVALRHICHAIVDCPHSTPDVVEESEFEAVRSGCIREGQYRPEAALLVDELVYHARNRGTSVEKGDVLFAREAPAGEACLVPAGRNLCLGQRTVLLKVDRAQIAPELVLANLYSQEVQDRFQVEMHGSTVGNLRLPVIRGTTIVVPPRNEQAGLVKDFVEGIARIDALIAKAEEFVVLARERRAALITAAVTGQIDVIREAS